MASGQERTKLIEIRPGIDREIPLGSPIADSFGFTEDNFGGYLWQKDDTIIISFIISKDEGKGNFSKLLSNILVQGYTIQVPTPLGKMNNIVQRKGFKQKFIEDEIIGRVEIWELKPKIGKTS